MDYDFLQFDMYKDKKSSTKLYLQSKSCIILIYNFLLQRSKNRSST